jgi:hypothetical protein
MYKPIVIATGVIIALGATSAGVVMQRCKGLRTE